MTPMTLYAGQQRRQRCKNGVLDSVREGEDGMIGENAIEVRKGVMSYLGFLGVEIDEAQCQITGEEVCVTTPASKVKVYIIPTNEELAIARETLALVNK